ncbi:hypothetical protein F5Y09DRAFT_348019 [Xylaria sp. FL1042]|nr:hypothetical protein F5Y09DRAFT_348019 [Xylaria sp. FL1042]
MGVNSSSSNGYVPADPEKPDVTIQDQDATPISENHIHEESHKANTEDQRKTTPCPSTPEVISNTSCSSIGEFSVSTEASTSSSVSSDANDRVSSLASQVEVLSKELQQLSSLVAQKQQPIVETGTWSTMGGQYLNLPEEYTEERVNFVKPFKFDTYVTAIDEEGFSFRLNSVPDGGLYVCGVSWIAIVD